MPVFVSLCALQAALGAPSPRKPHLLVIVIAEQFRADYLDTYNAGFSEGGFNRLLREGAVFPRMRFDHITTLTAPDTAVLATGAFPEVNGIVGDRWYDREQRKVISAEEAWTEPYSVMPPDAGPSPGNLVGSAFADELRLASNGQSKVLVVSGNPAAAVMLSGRQPTGAYWQKPDGQFETSAHFAERLPGWVQDFNQEHPIMRFDGKPWVALDAQPNAAPLRVIQLSGPTGRNDFLALYHASPFAADDMFAFARTAIEKERLGKGEYTDLLIVHVSAPGRLALETGAHSPLMRDMVLRLDRAVADLLAWMEKEIGSEKVSLIFTGAHGTPPLPEEADKRGLSAGRVNGEDVVRAMNDALADEFDRSLFVEKYIYPFVYLNDQAQSLSDSAYRRALETVGRGALTVEGVAAYFTPETSRTPATLRDKLRRSWYPSRSGDLMLAYKPYYVERFDGGRGTSSGSFYRYDTDVPLLLFGAGFQPGRFEGEVDATSFAPTIAAFLGVPVPATATGTVLADALLATTAPSPTVGPPSPPPAPSRPTPASQ